MDWEEIRMKKLQEIIDNTKEDDPRHKAALEEMKQLHSQKMERDRLEYDQWKAYTQAETEDKKIASANKSEKMELLKTGAKIVGELTAIGITLNFEKIGIIATKAWNMATSILRK